MVVSPLLSYGLEIFYTISPNAKALLSTRIARGIIKRPNRHLIKGKDAKVAVIPDGLGVVVNI